MSNETFAALLDAVAIFILLVVISALLVEHSDANVEVPLPQNCNLGCELRSSSRIVTRGEVQCVYFEGSLDSIRLLQNGAFVEKCTVETSTDHKVSYKIHF